MDLVTRRRNRSPVVSASGRYRVLALSCLAFMVFGPAAYLLAKPSRPVFSELALIDNVAPSATAERGGYPFLMGVGVHLGTWVDRPIQTPAQTNRAVADLGFNSIRDDLGQNKYEFDKQAGAPNKTKALQTLLSTLPAGVRPVLALTGGDSMRFGGGLPQDSASQQSFADFAGAAAADYKIYNPIFEIWNEWNLGGGAKNRVHGTPPPYVSLAERTYSSIKRASPNSTVLVGSLASDIDPDRRQNRDWVWMAEAIRDGMLRYGDGVSVHMYNTCRPQNQRTPAEMIGRLEKLDAILRKNNGGREYPIYITEVGWPEVAKNCGFTPDQILSYSAQFLLSLPHIKAVKGVWIYELKDTGTDKSNLQHVFGLLDYDYNEKPSTCGVREALRILSKYRFSGLSTNAEGMTQVDYAGNSDKIHVVWAPDERKPINLSVPEGMSARQICSDQRHSAGEVLTLGIEPVVLSPTP
jgi:hypothetical protein